MPVNFLFGDGTANDDYIVALGAGTFDAGAGDDLILADIENGTVVNAAGNDDPASAVSLDSLFLITEDALVQNDDLPTAMTLNQATIGETEFYSVSLTAGSQITVDIDLGAGSPIGDSADLVVELVDSMGNVVATNLDGALLDNGSVSELDPYLSTTVDAGGTYHIRVSQYNPITQSGGVFITDASYVMTVSATDHAATVSADGSAQTLIGGEGDDTIVAQGGDDTITGDDGNDTIYAGSGEDDVDGGLGDDIIYAGMGALDNSGGGAETVHGGAGNDLLYSTGGGAYFGDEGDDTFYAGILGAVAQTFDGGSDTDTVNTRVTNGDTDINLITGVTNFNLGLVNVENVITGDGDDLINGSNAANTIFTYGGDDSISGRGGDDVINAGEGNNYINGGTGADQMVAGMGNDVFVVDNVGDNIVDTGGTDYVRATISYTLDAQIENLVLMTTANINGTGNDMNNIIVGNAGDNVLNGGAGADIMRGLDGNDTYIVDNVGDRVSEAGSLGYDTVASSVSFTLSEGLERLILQGDAAINGFGNGADNALYGNNAANTLNGRGGNDSLYGNGGEDRLFGEAGDDAISGGAGADFILGGTGRDVLTGGTEADAFVFQDGDTGNSFATADRITDFSQLDGDLIRLNLMDADTTMDGNQAFDFIGNAAFSGTAGELRYGSVNGNTYVYADTDGDGQSDFMIRLDGLHLLTDSDFVL